MDRILAYLHANVVVRHELAWNGGLQDGSVFFRGNLRHQVRGVNGVQQQYYGFADSHCVGIQRPAVRRPENLQPRLTKPCFFSTEIVNSSTFSYRTSSTLSLPCRLADRL